MTGSPSPMFWMTATIALSALTAFVVARKVADPTDGRARDGGNHGDAFHTWLHEQLKITPEQEHQLAPIEQAYADQRNVLQERIGESGRKLADALENPEAKREQLDAALAEIRAAQGELQGVTIHHFLEMKEHLSPEQAGKLLQWTRESIINEPHP